MVSNFNVCEDVVTRDKGSLSFFCSFMQKERKTKKQNADKTNGAVH